ncbi:MAG: hypothetical protein F4Y42_20135 [Caldilineaceae bacterium SB0664_bin_27]|uniref:Uncharacterized protein n=1 Tax=Caldilineaceae bacterium SB0664_bin_27 TaxID=2605260 RepID=A0A6B0YZX5_9CHLR|nr:hypothetical protein [Caldilineaceae bacterium SB0664_bin_27]
MKRALLLYGLIFLLSGCAVDPASLALIAPNEPVEIPPRFTQHLNSLQYLDEVPVLFFNAQGESVSALGTEQMKNDHWLQLWAMTAMEDDGSLGLGKTLEKGEIPDVTMDDHMIAAIYMNAFATAERLCIENRAEVTEFVEAFAAEAKGLENVQFPYLTVIHDLAARLTLNFDSSTGATNCGDYLASLSEFPVARSFCFGSAPLFEANQVKGQKAQMERMKETMEKLASSPQSLLASFASLSCSSGVHE